MEQSIAALGSIIGECFRASAFKKDTLSEGDVLRLLEAIEKHLQELFRIVSPTVQPGYMRSFPRYQTVRPQSMVWMSIWGPGIVYPFHDHGNVQFGSYQLHGELTENIVDIPAGMERSLLHDFPTTAHDHVVKMGSIEVHPLPFVHSTANSSRKPVASLHVCSPRLTEFNLYEFNDNVLRRVKTELM